MVDRLTITPIVSDDDALLLEHLNTLIDWVKEVGNGEIEYAKALGLKNLSKTIAMPRKEIEEFVANRSYHTDDYSQGWVLVTNDDGVLVGACIVAFTNNSNGSSVCNVFSIYVNPDFRRQGIAKKLLLWIKEECKKDGISNLSLSWWEGNVAAQKLYYSMGFKPYLKYATLEI